MIIDYKRVTMPLFALVYCLNHFSLLITSAKIFWWNAPFFVDCLFFFAFAAEPGGGNDAVADVGYAQVG